MPTLPSRQLGPREIAPNPGRARRGRSSRHWLRRLLALSLCALLCGAAAAQTADEAPPASAAEPLVAEADRLSAEIGDLAARHGALEQRVREVEGEEARGVLRQMSSVRADYLDRLHALIENLAEQEEQALGTAGPLRAEIEPALAQMVPRMIGLIDEAEAQLAAIRGEIANAPSSDQKELRQLALFESRAIDGLYEGFDLLLRDMERLDLDAEAGQQALRERLVARADRLAGWIRDVKARIDALRLALSASPEDADARAQLAFAETRLDSYAESLSTTLDSMTRFDLVTAEYQQLLIETTGEITGDILDRDIAVSLIRSWTRGALDWLRDSGPGLLFKSLLFVVIMLLTSGVARLTRSLVERAVTNSKLRFSQLLQDTLVSWASRAVMILGLLIALSQLGIELGPLLAGLGVAGFIVGFALQDTLGNFASGAMILIYRPYDVGDMVDVAGVFGRVSKMSLVATTILTIDNQTMVVPNSKIWGDVIKNVTDQRIRRIDMKFGIAYEDDIDHAQRVFESILAEDERVLDDPPPVVRLHELGASSVDFVVRPWVATEDYWEVYWDTTRAVKVRLEQEGLHIPFPQRDVHLRRGAEDA